MPVPRFFALFTLIAACASSILPAAEPAQEKVLATLDPAHPRLLIKADELADLKGEAKTDPVLARYIADVTAKADGYVKAPPLEYKLVGPRLLGVSRECLYREYALGLAWELTDDEKYFAAARDNLLAVCAFPDWHPAHFLDTAEMTHAVAIGYDMLYEKLGAQDRATIEEKIVKYGLEPGMAVYTGAPHPTNPSRFWAKASHNWNMVCNGGLMIGALAVGDKRPEISEKVLEAALKSLPIAMATYGPDGSWPEGPGYWGYATNYVAYAIAALKSAVGSDYDLLKTPGLDKTGMFPIAGTGPTGSAFNFADAGEGKMNNQPVLFWLARAFNDPFLSDHENDMLAARKADPLDVIWYRQRSMAKRANPPLDQRFRGPVDVMFFRSAWNDPQALFLAIKGGSNKVNHAHLDLGSFVFEAQGVRWAIDLGSDDYNLPEYFGKLRWTYYRLNSTSHNVPLIGGASQRPDGKAEVVSFREGGERPPETVIDLTNAYTPAAKNVMRGASLVEGRKAALIEDEIELKGTEAVTWGMTTRAEITIEGKGDEALLRQSGKRLTAKILAPAGAKFEIESAEQPPPQKTNKGVRRLVIHLPSARGANRIAVLLSPQDDKGARVASTKVTALAEW